MPIQGVTNFLLNTPYYSTSDAEQLAENQIATVEWANQTPFCAMYAVTGNLAGSVPQTRQTPTQTFLVQCGDSQPTFDGLGIGTLTFPRTFPNGLLSCVVTCGTDHVYYNIRSATTSSVQLAATNTPIGNANSPASGVIGVAWVAIGW